MEIKASLNKYGRSDKKMRQSLKMIVGLKVDEAAAQLNSLAKGYAEDLKKLLISAVANAKNNHNLDENNLFVKRVYADQKATLKRWMPRAYGRACQILKRSCCITIVLDELEKKEAEAPAEKSVAKKDGKEAEKAESVAKEEASKEEKEEKKKADFKNKKEGFKPHQASGKAKQVFRRKSF